MAIKFSKKPTGSTLQLLIIIVLSLFVGVSIFTYTSGVERRVKATQELQSIYIVSKQITSGTSLGDALNNGNLEKKDFPTISIPTGAIKIIDGLNSKLVALQNIQPGQILVESNFGAVTAKTGSLVIPDGQVAVTITVGEPNHVGSFIQPGSEVIIFATGKQDAGKATKILLPKALIIAVGNQVVPTETPTSSSTSALITLAVTPYQAAKLIHGVQTLSLYFGLIGNLVNVDQAISITDANVLSQG